ncbi:MAG: hypothetical protein MUE98_10840, partial [Rhodobacteraceae bacterium]|nr:hypothetical protein [Paracoccaceae bacterium]
FEEATGCAVNVKTANTSDEMVALMNEGGFDLVTASGDASLRLIAGKRVQPVNVDLIPSWSTVDDRLKDAPWHTVDGVHYRRPRGTWCSSRWTCPTASRTRGACRPMTGRSMWRTPRST